MIGGKIIKNLKLAYNDIFNKNAKEYWHDEGNNKRMQFYYKIANYLDKIKTGLSIFVIFFIAYQITKIIVALINGFDVCSVVNCMEISKEEIANEIFTCVPLMITVVMNLMFCSCLKGRMKPKNFIYGITISVIIAPSMYLLILGSRYNLVNSLLITILFLIYIFIVVLLSHIIKKIYEIYDIAVGNDSVICTDEIEEVPEKVVENKKKKKERRK